MRDVTEQVTAYFDATVERITAEDVLAGSAVRDPADRFEPARTPRLRPAWVLTAGFVATIVLVGGAVGVAQLLDRESGEVGAPPPVGDGGDGPSGAWGLLIAAGVILVLAVAGLVWRNRREIVKEQTMQTLERPEVEVSPRPRSPAILVVLTVLLVLAAGALGWWIGSTSDSGATGDIPEIIELVNKAWVDGDAEALAALYTEEGVFEDMELELPASIRGDRYVGTRQIVSLATRGTNTADFEEMKVDKVMTLDNLIVYEWTASGISSESPFEATGVTVLEMEDGLIARSFYYYFSPELFNVN